MPKEDPRHKGMEAMTRHTEEPAGITQVKSKEQNAFYLGQIMSAKRFNLPVFKDTAEYDQKLRQSDTGDLNRSAQLTEILKEWVDTDRLRASGQQVVYDDIRKEKDKPREK
jgi:hypothetical protein